MKKPLIGYKTEHGEVIVVGVMKYQVFESEMLPGDKLNHLVTMDGQYCTCDPMPIAYSNSPRITSCLHRKELKMHMEEYNKLPDEENDDWLEFIKEQDDRRTLWMM